MAARPGKAALLDIEPELAEALEELQAQPPGSPAGSAAALLRGLNLRPPAKSDPTAGWTGAASSLELTSTPMYQFRVLTADDPSGLRERRGPGPVALGLIQQERKPAVAAAVYPNDGGQSRVPMVVHGIESVGRLLHASCRHFGLPKTGGRLYTTSGLNVSSMAQLQRLSQCGNADAPPLPLELVVVPPTELLKPRRNQPRRGGLRYGIPQLSKRTGPPAKQRPLAAWGGPNERSEPRPERVLVTVRPDDASPGVQIEASSLVELLASATERLQSPVSRLVELASGAPVETLEGLSDGAELVADTGPRADGELMVALVDLDLSSQGAAPGSADYYHSRLAMRPNGRFAMLEHSVDPTDPEQIIEGRWEGKYSLAALAGSDDLWAILSPDGDGQIQFGGVLAADGESFGLEVEVAGAELQTIHTVQFWFLDEQETHKPVPVVSCRLAGETLDEQLELNTRNGNMRFAGLTPGKYQLSIDPITHFSQNFLSFEGKDFLFQIEPSSPKLLSWYIRLERSAEARSPPPFSPHKIEYEKATP